MPHDDAPTVRSDNDARSVQDEKRGAGVDVRRLHIVFRGQVQGVGFRWTAQRKARKVGCTGWVRNEYDGSVSMELQGTNDQIARYFSEFELAYASFPIRYVIDEKDDIDPIDGERDFSVRF